MNAAMSQRPGRLAYDDPRGSPRVRQALQGYLWRARTLSCEIEQILVVSGSQQGLDMCARLLLDPSDSFVIEATTDAIVKQNGDKAAIVEVVMTFEHNESGEQQQINEAFRTRIEYVNGQWYWEGEAASTGQASCDPTF